jgi:LysM repeat protein
MPPQTNRSPGRLLAPVALVAVLVALLLVVLGSTGTQDTQTSKAGSRTQSASTGRPEPRSRAARGVYTVKSGDNLGEIAERNGTTVETLQELNPDLDARTLVPGQRIKLRQ